MIVPLQILVLKDSPRYIDLAASGWAVVEEHEACGHVFVVMQEPEWRVV